MNLESNDPEEKPKALAKKERREARRHEEEKRRSVRARTRNGKTILIWASIIGVTVLFFWFISQSESTEETDAVISRQGIHWHQDISITIKGEQVTIPANIGLGAGLHADMHTHSENDRIHLEMSRPVRESDTRLGSFFEIWGKRFDSQCIFEACTGDDGMLQMYVNGEENFDYENYLLKDGDKIEIVYE